MELVEQCAVRFGPAALLLWWLLAFGGHAVIGEWSDPDIASSDWKAFLAVASTAAVFCALAAVNLGCIVSPKSLGPCAVTSMVSTMLCVTRAGPRVLDALELPKPTGPPGQLASSLLVREGPLPLLYVLLVCDLPSASCQAAGVAIVYLLVSVIAELSVPRSARLADSTATSENLALLLGFGTLVILRRECKTQLGGLDGLGTTWRRRLGPASLLIWWLCITYRFVVVAHAVLSASDRSAGGIQTFIFGVLAAIVLALDALGVWLIWAPGSVCMEVLFSMSALLFAGGLYAVTERLPDALKSHVLFDTLCAGPLPVLHMLLVCELPTDIFATFGVAAVYTAASGVAALLRPDATLRAEAFEEWAVTLGIAGLGLGRRSLSGLHSTAATAASLPPSPSIALRRLPREPGQGDASWLLPQACSVAAAAEPDPPPQPHAAAASSTPPSPLPPLPGSGDFADDASTETMVEPAPEPQTPDPSFSSEPLEAERLADMEDGLGLHAVPASGSTVSAFGNIGDDDIGEISIGFDCEDDDAVGLHVVPATRLTRPSSTPAVSSAVGVASTRAAATLVNFAENLLPKRKQPRHRGSEAPRGRLLVQRTRLGMESKLGVSRGQFDRFCATSRSAATSPCGMATR